MSTLDELPEHPLGPAGDRFARAIPVADTILWEGYVLYPYRASSAKNRLRFNWGIVGPAEGRSLASSIVVDASKGGAIQVRVRFLHLVARSDGWDEAVPVRHDVEVLVDSIGRDRVHSRILVPGTIDRRDNALTYARERLSGSVVVAGRRILPDGDGRHVVLTVTVHNDTPADDSDREVSLRRSFVGCHVLLAANDDVFVSALEPPAALESLVAGLEQHRAWPVLIGPEPARDLVLASPVILYDYPAVADQSAGDFYDSTEIDEMLALRVHTLTEQEKADARALDPRTRAIIDRHDGLDPGVMAELHGTIRDAEHTGDASPESRRPQDPNPSWSDPGPDTVVIGGRSVGRGCKVRLEPGKRADVHDMFLRGRTATVREVVHDVDGLVHVAVIVDDDPAADMFEFQRRYLYFAPEELVSVGGDDE